MAALLALALVAPAASQVVAYFGPVDGTVADPGQFCARTCTPQGCIDTDPQCGTVVWASAQWLTPAPSGHCPTCQEFHQSTVCELVMDTYGPNIGNPRVEVPALLVWQRFYPAYFAACPRCFQFGPDDRQVCSILLHVGQCLKLSGHETATPDVLGQTWIADTITTCP